MDAQTSQTIAFHFDRITMENPELSLDRMIDDIAKAAECDVSDVAEFMEDRLDEIETRPRKKRRAPLAL